MASENPIDLRRPENDGVLAYLAGERPAAAVVVRVEECGADLYYGLGSHPDVVQRVLDELGADLPREARLVVYGNPALVLPDNGIIVAVALGTTYALRIPADRWQEAVAAKAKQVHQYSAPQRALDVSREFGPDWFFGQWHRAEPAWCRGPF